MGGHILQPLRREQSIEDRSGVAVDGGGLRGAHFLGRRLDADMRRRPPRAA